MLGISKLWNDLKKSLGGFGASRPDLSAQLDPEVLSPQAAFEHLVASGERRGCIPLTPFEVSELQQYQLKLFEQSGFEGRLSRLLDTAEPLRPYGQSLRFSFQAPHAALQNLVVRRVISESELSIEVVRERPSVPVQADLFLKLIRPLPSCAGRSVTDIQIAGPWMRYVWDKGAPDAARPSASSMRMD